jgi:hypothetical protein
LLHYFTNQSKYYIVYCFATWKIITSILQKLFYLRLKKLTLKYDLEGQGGLFFLSYCWFYDSCENIPFLSLNIFWSINFNLQTQQKWEAVSDVD